MDWCGTRAESSDMTIRQECPSTSGKDVRSAEPFGGRSVRRKGMHEFGTDILLRIFSRVNPASLAYCSAVCTAWHRVIKTSPSLWKVVYFLDLENLGASKDQCASTSSRSMSDLDWKACYIEEDQKTRLVGPSSYRTWKAHSGRVNCCKMIMGLIASGSSDQTARIWCAETLQCLEQYKVPHKAPVVHIEFDENKVIGAAGKEMLIWSRGGNRRLLRNMGGHAEICSMCHADPNLVVGCADGTVRVFDIYSGRCTQMLRQHTEPVKGVVMDSATQTMASGSSDGTVQLYDAQSGQKVSSLLRPSSMTGISCLQLSSANHLLFAGAMGGNLYCFDLRKRKTLWTTRVGGSALTCMHCPSYSDSVIATGGFDGTVKVFKTDSGERITTTCEARRPSRLSPSPILSIALGLTRIVTAHTDSFMTIYSLGGKGGA
ncbi:hypothetical protein MPTK1_7g15500 [Marchantia polymorpha subsp. ruderalis]|uniref:F-box domain-containing protein n=3 Tax=Marchantia polymorpha TaxID=3197 RepID=A0AAF6BZZ3_MARPO|nr:hypothetical protein MARPO_0009s0234 [Marchantia polymorpha]BBN17577.1 hypothetical protein Mp_7g15500 [Marchantia polymorpha subsp. ruderalis]|eukprot:PTQ47184.1 hypothetical protein MARPO_0009s0234 [Marchantia polymorpha]